MSDATSALIAERESLDRGLSGGLVLSTIGHLAIAGIALTAAWWKPFTPLEHVAMGHIIPLPPGGQGDPNSAPAVKAPPVTQAAEPEPPAPEPAPRVVKPPVEVPRPRLAEPEARPVRRKPDPTPVPRTTPGPSARDARAPARPAAPAVPGAGTSSATPGLALAPPGAGVSNGTDLNGDWYLAAVQRKIWMLWMQQLRLGFVQPIGVTFTILANGQVEDVHVTQPSGVFQLDAAAQRAVMSAAPFSPLPRTYGTTRYTIQAIFQPTP